MNTSKGKILINSYVINYIEICSTLEFKQLIKIPTRIKSDTSTLIDHILTSSTQAVVQVSITEPSLTDHQQSKT